VKNKKISYYACRSHEYVPQRNKCAFRCLNPFVALIMEAPCLSSALSSASDKPQQLSFVDHFPNLNPTMVLNVSCNVLSADLHTRTPFPEARRGTRWWGADDLFLKHRIIANTQASKASHIPCRWRHFGMGYCFRLRKGLLRR